MLSRDRQIGKKGVTTYMILNQQGQNVMCLCCYQPKSIFKGSSSDCFTKKESNGIQYTIVVAETMDSLATLQYLAPYIGAILAEYFMFYANPTTIIEAAKINGCMISSSHQNKK
ncbi:hypothetical protein I3843_02G050700 [Carya illinoinensis]|nr:hypothetical protein I3843_02G050700 [Carya illinoinensis]